MHPSSECQLSGKRASIRDQTSGPKSVVPLVLPGTSRATLEVLPIGSSCGVNRGRAPRPSGRTHRRRAGRPRRAVPLALALSFTAHFSSIIFLLHDVFLSFPGSAAGYFRRRQRSVLRRDVPDVRAFDPACRTTPFPRRPLAVPTTPFDKFCP